jgi:hypothetical protein
MRSAKLAIVIYICLSPIAYLKGRNAPITATARKLAMIIWNKALSGDFGKCSQF